MGLADWPRANSSAARRRPMQTVAFFEAIVVVANLVRAHRSNLLPMTPSGGSIVVTPQIMPDFLGRFVSAKAFCRSFFQERIPTTLPPAMGGWVSDSLDAQIQCSISTVCCQIHAPDRLKDGSLIHRLG